MEDNKMSSNLTINIVFIFSLMLFPLAFDYRTTDGASKVLIVALSLMSLLSGFFLIYKIRYLYSYSTNFIISTLLFIIGSTFSSFIHGHNIYSIFSSEIPLLLFLVSFIVMSSIHLYKNNLHKIIMAILGFMFLSVFFKFFFGFYYYNLTLSTVRYEIISPLIILLFSYGLTSAIYSKKKWGTLSLAVAISIAFLAVTRTYLIVFFIIGLFWIIILPYKYWIKNIKFILKIFLLFLFLFIIFYILSPEMVERWIVRLFTGVEKHGVDITYITRIAESSYQIDKLLESFQNLLFGLGISGETGFSSEYRKVLSIVYADDFEFKGHGFGHNTYVGIIFTSGIVVGSIFIYSLLSNIIKAIKLSKVQYKITTRNKISNPYIKDYFFIMAWGTSSAMGYATYALLAGLFGDRLYSLAFGLSFGLIFLGRRFFVKSIK
jgi:hypothetical protein